MQIKSIVAAASILACLLPASTAIAASDEQDMTPTAKPAATVKVVRNTRPLADHHKDARACLEAKTNETIIKCANKYR